jgi:MFS family permease
MPAYLPTAMGYTPVEAIQAQNICLVILSFGLLTAAWVGDRIPRRWILGAGGFIMMVLSIPFFTAAANHTVGLFVLFAGAGLAASLVNGPMSGVAADLFPTRIRFSGVAISFNLAFSIFSGIAPLMAALLQRSTGSPIGPAYYMCVCALLTFVGSLFLHRYDGRILQDHRAAVTEGAPASSFPAQ